jgi:hypothetical protein
MLSERHAKKKDTIFVGCLEKAIREAVEVARPASARVKPSIRAAFRLTRAPALDRPNESAPLNIEKGV